MSTAGHWLRLTIPAALVAAVANAGWSALIGEDPAAAACGAFLGTVAAFLLVAALARFAEGPSE